MVITTDGVKRNNLNDVSDEQIMLQAKQMGEAVKNEPRVSVFLQMDLNKGDNEQEAKFVAVNGYQFLIPRGREVQIPYCVYTVLQQCRLVR